MTLGLEVTCLWLLSGFI